MLNALLSWRFIVPCSAATWRGDCSAAPLFMTSGVAPEFSRACTISWCLRLQAMWSAVDPSSYQSTPLRTVVVSGRFTSALLTASNVETISAWEQKTAHWRGVKPTNMNISTTVFCVITRILQEKMKLICNVHETTDLVSKHWVTCLKPAIGTIIDMVCLWVPETGLM